MKTLNRTTLMAVALIATIAFASVLVGQETFRPPAIYASATGVVGWRAGTLNNGGHLITIAAGTTATTTTQTSCAAPAFSACNFLYSDLSGTVAVTTTPSTALASGNVVMALIETSNANVITRIVVPPQAGSAWNTSLPYVSNNCGTVGAGGGACGNTVVEGGLLKQVFGTVQLVNTGPASNATVTGIVPAFASSTSYTCTVAPETAAAASTDLYIVRNSASSVSFYQTASKTTVLAFHCIGY